MAEQKLMPVIWVNVARDDGWRLFVGLASYVATIFVSREGPWIARISGRHDIECDSLEAAKATIEAELGIVTMELNDEQTPAWFKTFGPPWGGKEDFAATRSRKKDDAGS